MVADAQPRRRNRKDRVVGRVTKIRRQRQGNTAAEAEAVDQGDHRLFDAGNGRQRRTSVAGIALGARPHAALAELRYVGARNERRSAGACQDHDADVRVAL